MATPTCKRGYYRRFAWSISPVVLASAITGAYRAGEIDLTREIHRLLGEIDGDMAFWLEVEHWLGEYGIYDKEALRRRDAGEAA
jgi:hypothetical protein